MIFKALLLLTIPFTLLSSTSYGQLKKAPSWVKELPINDNAYYGIGTVDMKLYPEYRAKARKIALRDITEKIFVSISSSSSLTMTYENQEVDYLLDETVSMASSNFLSGHQRVDDWIDKRSNKYYVLFKLNKETYKANRKSYFTSLETIITLMQNEADELFKEGEVARGIGKLSEALHRLEDERKRIVEPEYGALLQKWKLASVYELERQIDRIGFNLERRYTFNALAREPLIIENFLVNKTTNKLINGLNLSLKVTQGDVFRYSFDHEHHEALSIYGMFPEKKVAIIQLVAELQLDDEIEKLLDTSVKSRFESHPVVIDFSPYKITFRVIDEYINPESDDNRMINYLRKITGDLGLAEVSKKEADYIIMINTSGRLKKYDRKYYGGAIAAKMTIRDVNNDRELYQHVMPTVSVKANSQEKALTAAFNRSLNSSDEFLVSFVTFLCVNHL